MRIQYLGTGAAEGVPSMFCNCGFCRNARARGEIRSRSQVLLEGELSIDFPPDAFYHAARQGVDLSAVKYLLVTHSHMDHFYAHDFILRGYKYAHEITSPTLQIYGNAEVLEVFKECTARELREEIGGAIGLHEVGPFEKITFGGWTAYTLPAKHSSKDPLLYLIERDGKRVLHLTDTGGLLPEARAYLKEIGGPAYDAVTLDCTFLFSETQPSARHMGLDEVSRVLAFLEGEGLIDGHTERVITHFSHNAEPTSERLRRAEREYGVIAAYDGMTLEI